MARVFENDKCLIGTKLNCMKSETRKILVLYVYNNHHELVETTTKLVGERGFLIDALCVSTFRYLKRTKIAWPWVVYLADFFINKLQITRAQVFFYNLLGKKLFKHIIDKYDFIDFQSFPSYQTALAEYCASRKKEYMISFWGSDALRASEEELNADKTSLDGAKYIKLNKQIAQVITNFYKERYGVDYSPKYRGAIDGVTNGNKDIFLLDALTESDINDSEPLFKGGNTGKLLVTIGYNGSTKQNHIKAIEILMGLSKELKSKIHLVFPMTYGTPAGYFDRVLNTVSESGISYTLLDKFLTNKDICVLRKITDIFIMLQDTDGFSGSVRSHVYCQNVCLIAEWLDYPIAENNVYYERVNWDNLLNTIIRVITDYDKHKEKCMSNKERMRPFMTWDKYIDYTYNLYK